MPNKIRIPLTETTTSLYEADDGPLTSEQITQIQNSAPKAQGGKITSNIFPCFSTHDH
jgi:hypothetical protein